MLKAIHKDADNNLFIFKKFDISDKSLTAIAFESAFLSRTSL